MPKTTKPQKRSNYSAVSRAARMIDELAAFEEFKDEILPMLRADIAKGTPPAALRKKYETYIAARQITEALTNPDAAIALSAARDISDRNEGKPVERKVSVHKYENLPEEQLNAALESQVKDLEDLLN